MAISLGMILVLGILSYQVFQFIRLPGFLGLLFLGMVLGPHGINWIDSGILSISPDLRKIALIIILLRAGLGLHRKTLKMVGMPALRLGLIPVVFEGFAILLAAFILLDMGFVEAGMLGFIIAAVSPAVIVPKMLYFMEAGRGTDKGIPAMILAGASLDDVVAITLFSAFAGYYTGSQMSISGQIASIPISMLVGVMAGIGLAVGLIWVFKRFSIRHTKKALVVLAMAIILTFLEDVLQNIIPLASLLGVMVTGFVIYEKTPELGRALSDKFNKIWVFAEILLFFLVGAEVNYLLALDAGFMGLLIIFTGLLARALAVYLSLVGTNLTFQEKSFCVMAYSPKATVQAAIGAVPMALGAPGGELILTIAVLSIIVTAPLGSISMNLMGNRYLLLSTQKDNPKE